MNSAAYDAYHRDQELIEFSNDELVDRLLSRQFLSFRQKQDAFRILDARMLNGFPYFRIACRYGVPYGEVLRFVDAMDEDGVTIPGDEPWHPETRDTWCMLLWKDPSRRLP